eukprot:1356531-Amphidinium_carterae.1
MESATCHLSRYRFRIVLDARLCTAEWQFEAGQLVESMNSQPMCSCTWMSLSSFAGTRLPPALQTLGNN